MKQMADLYRQTQQWQVYAQVLRKLVRDDRGPARARRRSACGSARCRRSSSTRPSRRSSYYREALEAVPTQLGALKALERIYRSRSRVVRPDRRPQAQGRRRSTIRSRRWPPSSSWPRPTRIASATRRMAIEQYQRGARRGRATTCRRSRASSGSTRSRSAGRTCSSVLERQLELVSNERERIALLLRIAEMWEEEFLKPDKAAERLEQVLEHRPDHVEALQRPRAALPAAAALGRADRDLRAPHRRRRSTAARRPSCYQQIGDVYRDELERPRARDRRVPQRHRDRRGQPATRSRRSRELYEQRGEHGQALDVMERLAQPGRATHAEGRACYYRMGKLLRRASSATARRRSSSSSARSTSTTKHLPSLEAMREDLHRRGRLPRGRARARAGDRGRAERAPRRASSASSSAASTTSGSTSTSARSSASRTRSSSTPTTTARRVPLVDEYMEQERCAGRRAAAADAGAQRRGHASRRSKHRFWFLLGQVGRAAERRRHGGQGLRRGVRARQPAPAVADGARGRVLPQAGLGERVQVLPDAARAPPRRARSPSEITDALLPARRDQARAGRACARRSTCSTRRSRRTSYHRPTLEALVGLHGEQKEWEQVIHYKKRAARGRRERRRALRAATTRSASSGTKELKNPAKAIEAFAEASALQPKNHMHAAQAAAALPRDGAVGATRSRSSSASRDLDERTEAKAKYAIHDRRHHARRAQGRGRARSRASTRRSISTRPACSRRSRRSTAS